MRAFDQLQEAEIKVQFRRMYADLGLLESLCVLNEILVTGRILAEVITEEKANEAQ